MTSVSNGSSGKTEKPSPASSASSAPTKNSAAVLSDAPPPWHSVLFISVLGTLCFQGLPSMESIDEIATIETFTHRIFPDLIDIQTLGVIRLVFALTVWFQTIVCVFVSSGWDFHPFYVAGSKLRATPIRFRGIKTQAPFTAWCWNTIGVWTALSAVIALLDANGRREFVRPWMLRGAVLSWQIAAPLAPLVSAAIRYAIWPKKLRSENNDTSGLRSWRNLFAHNLNSIYCLTELGLLGGLPIRLSDASLAPLFGCVYVVFTWFMRNKWTDNHSEHGPQFIYFYIDTTLPGYKTTMSLVVLLTVLAFFFAVYYVFVHGFVDAMGGGLFGHSLFVIILSSLLVRVRD